MKAALLENWQKMEVKDIPKPEIEDGEALIKMKYAGVCGSDITVYTGSHPTATLFLQVRIFSKQEKCFADCLKEYLKQQRRCYTLTKVGNTR